MRRGVVSHHRARADHRHYADDDSWSERSVSADRSAAFDHRSRIISSALFAARETIVGKRRVGADEYVVFHSEAVPQLDPALDRHPVADDHVVFDEGVIA